MSANVITGVSGSFALASADLFEEMLGSAAAGMTGQVTKFELTVEQEDILHTPFSQGTTLGKSYYKGRATATCSFEGAYPSGRIFGGAAMTATDQKDFAPGATTVTLNLATSTGKTIAMTGTLFSPKLGVNRRTGLNTISGEVVGKITASA